MAGKAYSMKEMKEIVQYLVRTEAYKEVKGRQMWETFAKSGCTKRTWQSLKEVFLKRILPEISNPYYQLTPGQISCFRCGYDVNKRTLNRLDWNTDNSSIEEDSKKKQSTHKNSTENDDAEQAGPSGLAGESINSQNTIKSSCMSSETESRPPTTKASALTEQHSSSKFSDYIRVRSSSELFKKKKKTSPISSSGDINRPSSLTNIFTISSGSDESDIDQQNKREILKIDEELQETLCIADSQECIILDTSDNEATFNHGLHAATTTKYNSRKKIQYLNDKFPQTKEIKYEKEQRSVKKSKSFCTTSDRTADLVISNNSSNSQPDSVSPNYSAQNNVCEKTMANCFNDSVETLILTDASDNEVIELSSNDDRGEFSNGNDIDSFIRNVDVVKESKELGIEKVCNINRTDLPESSEVGVTMLNEVDALDIADSDVVNTFSYHPEAISSDSQANMTLENQNLEITTQSSTDISTVEKCVTPEIPVQIFTLTSTDSNSEDLFVERIECSKTMKEFAGEVLGNSVTSVIYLDSSETSSESLTNQNKNNTEKSDADTTSKTSRDKKYKLKITKKRFCNDVKSSQSKRFKKFRSQPNQEDILHSSLKNSSLTSFGKMQEYENDMSKTKDVAGKANKNSDEKKDDSEIDHTPNGSTAKNDQKRSQSNDIEQITTVNYKSLQVEQTIIQDTEILPDSTENSVITSANTAILQLSQCEKITSNVNFSKKNNVEKISEIPDSINIRDNTITFGNGSLDTSTLPNKMNKIQATSHGMEIMTICDSNDTQLVSDDINTEMHSNKRLEIGLSSKKTSSCDNETILGENASTISDNNGTSIENLDFIEDLRSSKQQADKEKASTIGDDSDTNIASCSNKFSASENASIDCDKDETNIGSLGTEIPLNIICEIWSLSNPNLNASTDKEITTASGEHNDRNEEHFKPQIPSEMNELNDSSLSNIFCKDSLDKTRIFCHSDSNIDSSDTQIPPNQLQDGESSNDRNTGSLGTQIQTNLNESFSSENIMTSAVTGVNETDMKCSDLPTQTNEIRKDYATISQNMNFLSDKGISSPNNYNHIDIEKQNTQISPNQINESQPLANKILTKLVDKGMTLSYRDDNNINDNVATLGTGITTNKVVSQQSSSHKTHTKEKISTKSPGNIDVATLDTQIPPNKVLSQSSSHKTHSNDNVSVESLEEGITLSFCDDNINSGVGSLDTIIPPHKALSQSLSHKICTNDKDSTKSLEKGITLSLCDDIINSGVGSLDTQIPPNKVLSRSSSDKTYTNDSERISKSISGDNSSMPNDYNREVLPTQVEKCNDKRTHTTQMKQNRNKSGDMSKLFGFSKGSGKPTGNRSKNRTIDTTADETIDITMDDAKDKESRDKPELSLKKTNTDSSSGTDGGLEATFEPGNIKRNSQGNLMVVYGSKVYPLVAKVGGDVKQMKWLPEGREYITSMNSEESEKQEGHVLLREHHRNRSQRIARRSRSISSLQLPHTEDQTCKRSRRIKNNERRLSGDSSNNSPIRAKRNYSTRDNRHKSYERMSSDTKVSNDCRMMTLRLSTDKDSVDSRKYLRQFHTKLRRDSPVCDLPLKRKRDSYDIDRMDYRDQTSSDLEFSARYGTSRDVNWQKKCMESQNINVRLMDIIDKLMRDKTNSLEDITKDIRENSPVFEVKSRKVDPNQNKSAMVQEKEPEVVVIDDEDKSSNSSKVTVQLPAESAQHIIKLAKILQDTGVEKLDKILATMTGEPAMDSDSAEIKKRVDQREQKIFQEIEAMETGSRDAGSSPTLSIQKSILNDTRKINKRSPRNSKSKTKNLKDDQSGLEAAENFQLQTDKNEAKNKRSPRKVKSTYKKLNEDKPTVTVNKSQGEEKVTQNEKKSSKQQPKPKEVVESKTALRVPKTRNSKPTSGKKSPQTFSPRSVHEDSSNVEKEDGKITKARSSMKMNKEKDLTKTKNVHDSDEEIVFAKNLNEKSLSKLHSSGKMSPDLLAADVYAEQDTKIKSRSRHENVFALASSSVTPRLDPEQIEDDSEHNVRYMLPEMAKKFQQVDKSEQFKQYSLDNSKVTKRREKAKKRATSMDNFRAFTSSPETINDYIDSEDTNISSENRIVKRRRKSERPNRNFRSNSTPRRPVQMYPDLIRRRRRTLTDFLKIKRIGLENLECPSKKSPSVNQHNSLESYKSSMFETINSKQNGSINISVTPKLVSEENHNMVVANNSPHIVIDNRSQTISWTTVSPCENSQSAKSVKDTNVKIILDNILQNSLSPIAATSKSFDRSGGFVGDVFKRLSSSLIMGNEHINSTELSGQLESGMHNETVIEVQNESTFFGRLTKNINRDLTSGGVSGIACLPDISHEITSFKTQDKSKTLKPQQRPRSKSSTNVTSNSTRDLMSETTEKSSIIVPGRMTRSKSANNVKEPNVSFKSIPESLYKGITNLSLANLTGKPKNISKNKSHKVSDNYLPIDNMSSLRLPISKSEKKQSNKKDTIKIKILRPKKKHLDKNISETLKSQFSIIDHETPKMPLNSSGLNSKFQCLTFDSVIHEPMSVKFDSTCPDDMNSDSLIEVPQVNKIETISLDTFLGQDIYSDMEIGSECHVKKEENNRDNSSLFTLDLSDSQETLEFDSQETLESDYQNNDASNDIEGSEYSSEIDFITPINTNFSDIVERNHNQGSWFLLSEEESQSSPPRLEIPVLQPVPPFTNYPYIHAKSLFTDLSIINEDSKEGSRDGMIAKNFTKDINFNMIADKKTKMGNAKSVVGQSCPEDIQVEILSEPKLSEEEIFLTCPSSPVGSLRTIKFHQF